MAIVFKLVEMIVPKATWSELLWYARGMFLGAVWAGTAVYMLMKHG